MHRSAACVPAQTERSRQNPKTGVATRKNPEEGILKMSAFLFLAAILIILYKLLCNRTKTVELIRDGKNGQTKVEVLRKAPGPAPLPVIGNLHLLGKHESPFQAFTELAKSYGDIFSLKLGTSECVVVNNLELIREVLNQNGKFFGGRPNFLRFHQLFAGDRNNCKYLPYKLIFNLYNSYFN